MKIILDPGHGGGFEHNRGGLIFNEGDNNFNYSLIFKEELEKYQGVEVVLTRNNKGDNPSLRERAKFGEGADLFLSIHSNYSSDASVRGSEVWDSVETPNKKLAQTLVDTTSNTFKHPNRGVKYREGSPGFDYYGVLRFNKALSSMILEMGFHSNMKDSEFFLTNHRFLAIQQAESIAKFYGLKYYLEYNEKEHWAEKHFKSLKEKGIEIHEKRYDETITRGEVFALLDRIL